MSFLQAEWRKLILVNYEIDPRVLQPLLPAKTELDVWQGRCYVSVVGFMFLRTRLLGIKIPWHVNFPEVNLRFYVRHHDGQQWKRGVVFIQEIVPKVAISFVANTLYREHYVTRKMGYNWSPTASGQRVSYSWKKSGYWQEISVEAAQLAQAIEEGSEVEFITEHYWGYSQQGREKTIEYEVTHPRWEHYPVKSYNLKVDFSKNYGADFAFLDDAQPRSVMLAEGSPITVEHRRKL
ncbi:MAG: DUF2071 domain-containing protein [Bacteroidota bacterium]